MFAQSLPEGPDRGIDDVPTYAVIGAECTREKGAIGHLALLARGGRLARNVPVEVLEMGPGLHLKTAPGSMVPAAAGWVVLTPDQALGIAAWLERMRCLLAGMMPIQDRFPHNLRDYIVYPPSSQHQEPMYQDALSSQEDRRTGRALPRFSCAGFVECCYAEGAGIHLIDHEALPKVEETTVLLIWPQLGWLDDPLMRRRMMREGVDPERTKERLGLAGDWPKRLLLPGFLLHGLQSGGGRYKANDEGESHFPTKGPPQNKSIAS